MKVRKAGQKFSEQEDDNRAIDDLEKESFELVATLDPLAESERNRHADDEQKERKDQIRGRQPFHSGVFHGQVILRHDPGLFTSTIPTTVRPRKTSSEIRRLLWFDIRIHRLRR